jgi:hypothetical protein
MWVRILLGVLHENFNFIERNVMMGMFLIIWYLILLAGIGFVAFKAWMEHRWWKEVEEISRNSRNQKQDE